MRIRILGSGLKGGKLGTLFARARHEVAFSFARSQQKLTRFAQDAKGKARAGTPREAATAGTAQVGHAATPFGSLADLLKPTIFPGIRLPLT